MYFNYMCRQTGRTTMGLLLNTQNCGLRMRRECRERFPRHRLQRKPLVSDPGMHHGTCVTHVPWCLSGLLTRGVGENVPNIPGACATGNFTYLVRGPLVQVMVGSTKLFPEAVLIYNQWYLGHSDERNFIVNSQETRWLNQNCGHICQRTID